MIRSIKHPVVVFILGLICGATGAAVGLGLWISHSEIARTKISTLISPRPADKASLLDQIRRDEIIPTPTPTLPPISKTDVRLAITKALDEGEFEGLEEYETESVRFEVVGGDCCGSVPRAAVSENLSEQLKAVLHPWNLDDSNPAIVGLRNSLRLIYAETIVGVAADQTVVIFYLSPSNHIEEIAITRYYASGI
jgi:hypothetical protein